MKPILLKGHERSITSIRYNKDGDLLFSCGKDAHPCVWFSENGERLGTYEGHNGVVWSIDVTWDTKNVLTGSGDNFCMYWDCETGRALNKIQGHTSVRSVGFSYSGNLFFFAIDQRLNQECMVYVYDARDAASLEDNKAAITIRVPKSKVTSALWSNLDYMIVTGHENGEVSQYDLRGKSYDAINWAKDHRKTITDLQTSADQLMIISASKDQTARVFDAHTLELKKTFKSDRPVNSAAISPVRDHIALGGGEEAMDVTHTATTQGGFEARFYHLIFEEEFARLKGHFGPINDLKFHPDGKSLATGGEDGYVRLQSFDKDYFKFEFDY